MKLLDKKFLEMGYERLTVSDKKGHNSLTSKEEDVLVMYIDNWEKKDIAEEIGLSESSVDRYLKIVNAKIAQLLKLEGIEVKNLLNLINDEFVIESGILVEYKGDKEEVIIPEGVTKIGECAFKEKNVTKVTIPKSVVSIGNGAFTLCSDLHTVEMSYGLKSIGEKAFQYCSSLTTVVIPNSVETIEQGAFCCSGLVSIIIPRSVKRLGDGAYTMCPFLQSIEVDGKNTMYNSQDGVLFTKDKSILLCYPQAKQDKKYYVPVTVNTVAPGAFAMLNIFGMCTSNLESIYVPDNVTSIGDDAFSSCTSLTSITIPDSVTSIGNRAFYGCTGLTGITIPGGVTTIGDSAFYGCDSLTSITISDGVTTIGEGAFRGCAHLTDITIPDSVTNIGDYAFAWCDSITSIVIPDGVTTIGERVFDGCDDLDTIIVPNSVVNIAKHAFDTFDRDKFAEEQTSICEFYEDWNPDECQKKLDAMNEDDYMYCNITIHANPDSYIVQYAKENHIEYTVDGSFIMKGSTLVRYVGTKGDVVVPDGVTCIPEYAFSFYSDIISITIPDSVMEIGTCAFSPCSSLTSVTIGNGVTSIGYKAFCGCSNLTVIIIPNSVTSIGDDAFRGCSNLTIQAYPNSYAAQYAKENNIKLEII